MEPKVFDGETLSFLLSVSNVRQVSAETGISYRSLLRLRRRGHVRLETAERLSDFYRGRITQKKAAQIERPTVS